MLARRPRSALVAVVGIALLALGVVVAPPGSADGTVPQTITLLPPPPTTAPTGSSYTFATHGGPSGQPVLMHVAYNSNDVCTLTPQPGPATSFTLTFNTQGTCLLKGTQAGDATFAAADTYRAPIEVTQAPPTASVTAPLLPQTVFFAPEPPASAHVGQTSTFTALGGGSGQPVVPRVATVSTGICHVAPAAAGAPSYQVTYDAPGQCIVKARQDGDQVWAPAEPHAAYVEVSLTPQTVSFVPEPLPTALVGTTSIFTTSGGGSGLPVVPHVAFISNGICHLVPSAAGPPTYQVSYDAPGQCLIKAPQGGNAIYEPAPPHNAYVDVVSPPVLTLSGLTFVAGGYDVTRGSTYLLQARTTGSRRPTARVGQHRAVRMHRAGAGVFALPVHIGRVAHDTWIKVRFGGTVHRLLVRVHR